MEELRCCQLLWFYSDFKTSGYFSQSQFLESGSYSRFYSSTLKKVFNFCGCREKSVLVSSETKVRNQKANKEKSLKHDYYYLIIIYMGEEKRMTHGF